MYASPSARVKTADAALCRARTRRYTLEVVQAPSRARMCGFGDKVRS